MKRLKPLLPSVTFCLLVLLAACSSAPPVAGINYLNLPDDLAKADGLEGDRSSMIENTLDHLSLTLLPDIKKADTWALHLPVGSALHDEATLESELTRHLSDWHLKSVFGRHITLERPSRSGTQTFTVTRIPLPENVRGDAYGETAIILLTLYPVEP